MSYKLANCESKRTCAFTIAIKNLEFQIVALKEQLRQCHDQLNKQTTEIIRLCEKINLKDEVIRRLCEENLRLSESGSGNFQVDQ